MKPPTNPDQKPVDRRTFSKMSLAALGGTLITSACSKSKQTSQSPGKTSPTALVFLPATERSPQRERQNQFNTFATTSLTSRFRSTAASDIRTPFLTHWTSPSAQSSASTC